MRMRRRREEGRGRRKEEEGKKEEEREKRKEEGRRKKEEGREDLQKVFNRLREANMVAKFSTVVSHRGISPSPNKIQAIEQAQLPKTPKEIRQFLGLTSYFLDKMNSRKISIMRKLEIKSRKSKEKINHYFRLFNILRKENY